MVHPGRGKKKRRLESQLTDRMLFRNGRHNQSWVNPAKDFSQSFEFRVAPLDLRVLIVVKGKCIVR